MMTATREPQTTPVPAQSLAPPSRAPEAPAFGEPPPLTEPNEEEPAAEEPGYGFGV
jgi:hypothetical protein